MRVIRTSGLVLVLSLVGFGGGCGPAPQTSVEQEKANEVVREARRGTHQQLEANIKKAQEAARKQGPTTKAAPAGQGQ